MNKLLSQLAVVSALASSAVSAQQTMTYDQALAEITDPNLHACLKLAQKDHTYAHELTSLNCSGKNVADDTGIYFFTGLKQLYLNDNNLEYIDYISSMDGLEVLHVDNNNIQEVGMMQALMGSVKEISFAGNPIRDEGEFMMAHQLLSVSMSNTLIDDAYVFAMGEYIQYVDVSNNPILTSLGLDYTPTLRYIDASHSPILTEIGNWYHAPYLTEVYLHGTQVADISPLLNLGAPLKALSLSDASYCWQLDHLDNTMTIANYTRPTTCDNQDDNNDFDSDGVSNIAEVNAGTSPFVAQ